MNIDEHIARQFGRKRTFRVPENYFNNFHEQIMRSVEKCHPHAAMNKTLARIRPYVYAAACAALLLICTGVYMQSYEKDKNSAMLVTKYESTEGQDASLEQVADYMMLDDDDMYAYFNEE